MGIFATLVRRGAHAEPARGALWADGVGHGVPARFEAVLEQLQAGLRPDERLRRDRTRARSRRSRSRRGAGWPSGHLRVRGRARARLPRDAGDVRGLGRGVARLPPPALLRRPSDGPGQPCSSAGQGLGGLPGGRAGGDVAEREPRSRPRRPPSARPPLGMGGPVRGDAATRAARRDGSLGLPGRGVHREGQPFEAGRPRTEREPAREASGAAARSRRRHPRMTWGGHGCGSRGCRRPRVRPRSSSTRSPAARSTYVGRHGGPVGVRHPGARRVPTRRTRPLL